MRAAILGQTGGGKESSRPSRAWQGIEVRPVKVYNTHMMTAKKFLSALALVSLNGTYAPCDEIPVVGLKELPGIFAKIEKGDQEGGFLLQFLGADDKDAVPFLTERLAARDPRVRLGAANALAAIGPGASPAIPRLRGALEDEDEAVRAAAVWALGEIGTDKAVPALVEALSLPDLDIERFAREGLVKIGAPAKTALEGRLKELDPEAEAAAAIQRVLAEMEEDEARRTRMEKSHGFLKSIKRSTPSGPVVGSVADEGLGCRIWSLEGNAGGAGSVIYSEGRMRLDGTDIQLEHLGPRAAPFGYDGSKPRATAYDYSKGGPYLVMVEYRMTPGKAMYGADFRAVVRVNRGKETTVISGSGQCGD